MIWKEKYKIGVEQIDQQHEELFRRVADFVTTLRSPVEWSEKVEKVNTTLEFMKDYVVIHFHDEETYQRKIGYEKLDAHIKIHNNMVQYVVEFAEHYERTGCNEMLMQQFAGKLLAWLINHITEEDQKIADYAREKGVSGNE